MFGQDIKVGDYIVYAGLADRSAVLRAGRVLELKDTGKVFCQTWNLFKSQGYSWQEGERSGKQKNVTLGFLDRMVVVPAESVSEKIKHDLAAE